MRNEGAGTGGNGIINTLVPLKSGDGRMGLLLLTVSSMVLSYLLRQGEIY